MAPKRSAREGDWRLAPIRTYAEVVAIMRRNGDDGITTSTIWHYEQSAMRKLREALADLEDSF